MPPRLQVLRSLHKPQKTEVMPRLNLIERLTESRTRMRRSILTLWVNAEAAPNKQAYLLHEAEYIASVGCLLALCAELHARRGDQRRAS